MNHSSLRYARLGLHMASNHIDALNHDSVLCDKNSYHRASLALVFATGFLSLFKPSVDEEGEGAGDEESRVGSQVIDVASEKTKATHRSITLSHAIAPSDLPGFTKA